MFKRPLLLAALAVTAFTACGQTGTPGTSVQPGPDQTESGLQGLLNRRVSSGAGLSSANVASLQQTWSVTTTEPVSHAPLVQGGTVYFADWGGTAYAADAQTGAVRWQSKIETPMAQWPWHGLAGTGALGDGKLFEASVEGNAFALDQTTGKVLWQVKVTDQPTAGNLSKLLYYKGMVILGLQSVDEVLSAKVLGFVPSFRGRVMALDANTGKQLWEIKLVEAPNNGLAVWSSFALDPQTGTLFFDTGNNYTGDSTDLSDSMVAVDAQTGAMKWHYQVTSSDVWTKNTQIGPDYDFGAGPQLFEASVGGQNRKLVGAGQKSGFYSVFDRNTGAHMWSTFVGYASIGGGMRGEGSIGGGKIFVWSNNSYPDGKDPTIFPATVKALDPATGNTLWTADKAQPAVGTSAGYLSNDAYFVGSLDGTLQAYNAANGNVLWTGKVPSAVASALVVEGNQLFVGAGVPAAFSGGSGTSGMFAFAPKP